MRTSDVHRYKAEMENEVSLNSVRAQMEQSRGIINPHRGTGARISLIRRIYAPAAAGGAATHPKPPMVSTGGAWAAPDGEVQASIDEGEAILVDSGSSRSCRSRASRHVDLKARRP